MIISIPKNRLTLCLVIVSACSRVLPCDATSSTSNDLQAVLKAITENTERGAISYPDATRQGIIVIKSGTSFKDDISFLQSLSLRCSSSEFEAVLKSLSTKYQDEPYDEMQTYKFASDIYRSRFNDRSKELLYIQKAQQVQKDLQVLAALNNLIVMSQLADNYLATSNTSSIQFNRQSALSLYTQIVRFPSDDKLYLSRIGDFRRVQIAASLKIVELTELRDLHNLSLPLYAYEKVDRVYPKRAGFLNHVPIEVRRFNDQLSVWLDLKIKDEPKNSQLRPHLQAVLNSLKSER